MMCVGAYFFGVNPPTLSRSYWGVAYPWGLDDLHHILGTGQRTRLSC